MKQMIGPRLWKTGLAVTITVFLMTLTGHSWVYGAIAAALAIAPSPARSLRGALNQIGANILGGLIGVGAVWIFGSNPLVVGATVVGILLLVRAMHREDLTQVVITVTLFVMAPHMEGTSTYAVWRLVSVAVGAVVGTAVNRLVVPPDFSPQLLAAVAGAGDRLDQMILKLTDYLPEPERYAKVEVLADGAYVETAITEGRRLAGLLAESGATECGGVQLGLLQRALKVEASLLERTMVIHKAALTAQKAADYRQEVPALSAALLEVVEYRRLLYARLLGAGAPVGLEVSAGRATPAGLQAGLAGLEHRFEAPTALPERADEVETFFRLHRMRSGIAYMADRLLRLHVAMEASQGVGATAAGGVAEAAAMLPAGGD